jgi:hypothetical protein
MTEEIRKLVPRSKHDDEAADAAIAAGYPAVDPILPDLLEWLQDMNWPVAQSLAPFLASIGEPLIPHLKKIFESNDVIWKGWIVSRIIEENHGLALSFRDYLESLVNISPKDEDDEWLIECARGVLEKYGWSKDFEAEREEWLSFSLKNLERAYGPDEPDLPSSDE